MARGWESKSVEDQKSAAEADRDAQIKPRMSADERAKQERKQSLLLSRSQVVSRLKVATNDRYRAQLQLALDHLDERLREYDQAVKA
ncbi:MAG: hypothetical protein DMF74_02765 [Acidobacteria bacterium]|nr:MAG: hypothetical protein DMF74_02765 [Acidobacteriota bacterium]